MEGQLDIYSLLYRLGVTANYTGFFQTAYAAQLCATQPERLLLVTKWVYPDVAKQYRTNWKAVERNIRAVNSIIWQQGRQALEELAGRPLPHRPRTAQLLAILSYALRPEDQTPPAGPGGPSPVPRGVSPRPKAAGPSGPSPGGQAACPDETWLWGVLGTGTALLRR